MLPRLPSSMHAGATTPADAARCTCRFSSRATDGLPLIQGGSASALPVSRPAQRSLHVPACMVAELLNATLLSGVLQSMSLPPRTAPAATSRKRQLLGGIRTHQENAPFHGAPGSTGYSADWHRHHETNNRKRPQSELGAALTETCYRVHVKVSSWNPEPGCSRRAVGLTSVWTDGLPSEVGRDECPSGCHLPHAVIVPPTTSSKRPDLC